MHRARLLPIAASLVLALGASPALAKASAAQRCEAAKLKAVAAYDACRLAAEARAVLLSTSVDSARCELKLAARFDRSDERGGSECPTLGDAEALRALAEQHASAVAAALAGAPPSLCGNGSIDAAEGESCDGADLGGESCESKGFAGGTLACSDQCSFDTSGCQDSVLECDLLAQDCASPLESCYIGGTGSICIPTGAGSLGDSCNVGLRNECGEGMACVDLTQPLVGECVALCDPLAPACPPDLVCDALIALPSIGVCH